ncbi:hypothetical protein B0H10DRAFT_1965018 [Mycena sp. CBHHK59/15]|nr:hypothetical protein B0H10DRAFT_1965018 [Mycena sp. CBHHK59/15]
MMGRKRSKRQPPAPRKCRGKKAKKRAAPSSSTGEQTTPMGHSGSSSNVVQTSSVTLQKIWKYWVYGPIEQATLTTPKSRESSPKDLSSRSPTLSDEDLPEVPDRDTQSHSGMSREDLIYGIPMRGQNRDWDYFMDDLNDTSESEEELVVKTDSSVEEEVTVETEESSVFVETDVE